MALTIMCRTFPVLDNCWRKVEEVTRIAVVLGQPLENIAAFLSVLFL